jgi:hypothetical protein
MSGEIYDSPYLPSELCSSRANQVQRSLVQISFMLATSLQLIVLHGYNGRDKSAITLLDDQP